MDAESDDGAERLVRAAYLVGRDLLAPIELQARAEGAATGHHVHRLRVLLATLASWLEGHDAAWLDALRRADAELHRADLDRIYGRTAAADVGAGEALASAHAGRLRDALRAADRLTFARREVDLRGASLLVHLGADALREAIAAGELAARDDGRGPLVALDALAGFAAARGLAWDDGLDDPAAGDAHESRLRALVDGDAG
ncbi:MAG: hypothetical protein R3A79_06380 [Nannocystaceae bacterium]